jgi:hypothetical protein
LRAFCGTNCTAARFSPPLRIPFPPGHTYASHFAQPRRQNCRVVLNVADVHELVFERPHLVPGEAALRRLQVQDTHGRIDPTIAFTANTPALPRASKEETAAARRVLFPAAAAGATAGLPSSAESMSTFAVRIKNS